MSGEYLALLVRKDTITAIRDLNKDRPGCVSGAVHLGLLVDQRRIFQKLGSNFLEIAICDIDPLPKPGPNDKNVEVLTLGVDPNLYSGVEHKVGDFYDWMRRVLALRLRAEQLNIHYFNNGEYTEVLFGPQPQQSS